LLAFFVTRPAYCPPSFSRVHAKLILRIVSYRIVATPLKTNCIKFYALTFLADRTNGRAYATVLLLSLCPSVCDVVLWLNGAS